ncbi:pentapeptide repeat-containing protein, partial [Streptomyces sp. NPDC002491]
MLPHGCGQQFWGAEQLPEARGRVLLRGASFSGAVLRGGALGEVALRQAVLRETVLSRAALREATPRGVCLRVTLRRRGFSGRTVRHRRDIVQDPLALPGFRVPVVRAGEGDGRRIPPDQAGVGVLGTEPHQRFATGSVGVPDLLEHLLAVRRPGRPPVDVRPVHDAHVVVPHLVDEPVVRTGSQPGAARGREVEDVMVAGDGPFLPRVVPPVHDTAPGGEGALGLELGHSRRQVLELLRPLVVALPDPLPRLVVQAGRTLGQLRPEVADQTEVLRTGAEEDVQLVDRLRLDLLGFGQRPLCQPGGCRGVRETDVDHQTALRREPRELAEVLGRHPVLLLRGLRRHQGLRAFRVAVRGRRNGGKRRDTVRVRHKRRRQRDTLRGRRKRRDGVRWGGCGVGPLLTVVLGAACAGGRRVVYVPGPVPGAVGGFRGFGSAVRTGRGNAGGTTVRPGQQVLPSSAVKDHRAPVRPVAGGTGADGAVLADHGHLGAEDPGRIP